MSSFCPQVLGLRDSKGIEGQDKKDRDGYFMYTPLDGGNRPFWWQVDYGDITRGLRHEVEFWYTGSDRSHAPFENWYDRYRIEYNEAVDIWDSVSAGFEKGVYQGVKS